MSEEGREDTDNDIQIDASCSGSDLLFVDPGNVDMSYCCWTFCLLALVPGSMLVSVLQIMIRARMHVTIYPFSHCPEW